MSTGWSFNGVRVWNQSQPINLLTVQISAEQVQTSDDVLREASSGVIWGHPHCTHSGLLEMLPPAPPSYWPRHQLALMHLKAPRRNTFSQGRPTPSLTSLWHTMELIQRGSPKHFHTRTPTSNTHTLQDLISGSPPVEYRHVLLWLGCGELAGEKRTFIGPVCQSAKLHLKNDQN